MFSFTQRKNVKSAFRPVDGAFIFSFAEENDSNRSGSRIFSATARKKYLSVLARGESNLDRWISRRTGLPLC